MSPASTVVAQARTMVIGESPTLRTALADYPGERERLVLLVGAAVDGTGPDPDWASMAPRTGAVLARIHAALRAFVAPEGELLSGQRIVVLADEAAVLGDPDRPGESIVAGAAVALVRTLAMELRRRRSCINLLLGATIDRVEAPTPTPTPTADVLGAIDALLHCAADITGQEIHLAAASHLGRVRP